MMVVSDIEDVFVPLVDGFLVSPQEARSVVDRYVWVWGCCLMKLIFQKFVMVNVVPYILICVKQV